MDAPTLCTRPPTDDAAQGPLGRAPVWHPTGESDEGRGRMGTLIHHAALSRAIGALVIAMIEAAFRTLLMLPARRAHRRVPPHAPTRRRTVDVTPIAGRADAEGLTAAPARADTEGRHGPQRRAHGLEPPQTDRGTIA